MTSDEYDVWVEHAIVGFAAQQVASGAAPEAEAAAYAEQETARLLPDGIATPNHHLWTVRDHEGSPVGHLWLLVRPQSSEVEAFLYDVELVPEARGRGLGRATMLAGEDTARELGATVMRLNVFGHNVPAIRLYRSLGFEVAMAAMTKRLGDTEPLPADELSGRIELRDMTAEEYAVFRPRLEADYAANLARSTSAPLDEAARRSADDLGRLLPDGLDTPGSLIWTAYDGAQPVADLWLQVSESSDGLHAYGYQLEVREPLRRRGYARAVLHAAERACRERGVRRVGLSVFGFNDAARALYEQLGFTLVAQLMVKSLRGQGDAVV